MNFGQNVYLDHLKVPWYSGESYRAIMALLLIFFVFNPTQFALFAIKYMNL